MKDGVKTYWHSNGQKSSEGTIKNGQWQDKRTFFSPNGERVEEHVYINGKIATEVLYEEGTALQVTQHEKGRLPTVLKGILARMVVDNAKTHEKKPKVTQDMIQERIENQERACEEADFPRFAPRDGICFCCRKQIYKIVDGMRPITGCPHCCRSYCD